LDRRGGGRWRGGRVRDVRAGPLRTRGPGRDGRRRGTAGALHAALRGRHRGCVRGARRNRGYRRPRRTRDRLTGVGSPGTWGHQPKSPQRQRKRDLTTVTALTHSTSAAAGLRADAIVVGVAKGAKGPVLAPGAEGVDKAFDGKLASVLETLGASGG